jgi:hypothetical protein
MPGYVVGFGGPGPEGRWLMDARAGPSAAAHSNRRTSTMSVDIADHGAATVMATATPLA